MNPIAFDSEWNRKLVDPMWMYTKGWVHFRLPSGLIFNDHIATQYHEVVSFSMIKRVHFRLSKTVEPLKNLFNLTQNIAVYLPLDDKLFSSVRPCICKTPCYNDLYFMSYNLLFRS